MSGTAFMPAMIMARFKIDLRSDTYRKVLGFLFAHWARQPGRVIYIMGVFLGATLLDVATPYYAGQLVTAVSAPAGSAEGLSSALWAFGILIGFGLASVVLRQMGFFGIIQFTLKMMTEIAQDAFHRVQRFSTDWHANTFAGSTVRKITRGMWAVDMLNDTLMISLFPSFVVLVGSMVILGLHWPLLGVVIAIGTVIYIAMTAWLSVRYIAPAARLSNSWDTRIGATLADALTCNAVVKSFGNERREDARLAGVVGKWRKRVRRTWRRYTITSTVQLVVLLGMRASIIGGALLMWMYDGATPGDVTYLLSAYYVIHAYLRDVGQQINHLQRAVNDMDELVAIHDEAIGLADAPDAKPLVVSGGGITFDDVTFHYRGHTTPLYDRLSIAIRPGERVGLVGRSGSGKTTFVKLVQRLYDVTGGRVMIDAQDVSQATQRSLRSQIALVQQEPILFHRSLAENIAYGQPGATQEEIEQAAHLANAHEFITTLPRGYGTLVGERGVKLSGGERQRVALARAFLADAPILILDEATSSLDSESEALIQQAMARLMDGRTAIVIAHRLSTVRSLDRILVFDHGRVVEEGTHASLLGRADGLYRALFERQAHDLSAPDDEAMDDIGPDADPEDDKSERVSAAE
jgi:ATP-binding cassette subfamily B protein